MKVYSQSTDIAGRPLSFEVGRLANRATSAVLARYGETTVLATVVVGKEEVKKDYFPLSVDYQERLYAGGRIKGSRWVKREGRPTDAETLSGRLIDRSIRPLFPSDFRREVQVIITVLSTDTDNDADVLAINATSAALAISPIPWAGPVAASRIGFENGQLQVNPKNGNRPGVDLDLVVTSTEKLVNMLEAGARQIPDDTVLAGIETAFAANQAVIKLINGLVAECGQDKLSLAVKTPNTDTVKKIEAAAKTAVAEFVESSAGTSVIDREHKFDEAKTDILAQFDPADQKTVLDTLEKMLQAAIRRKILSDSVRLDGRKLDQIRPLEIEVGVLPRVHGSAIFQRGETQALTVTTLGAPSLSQSLESAEGEETKRYMHHYYFPPFSTGETGKVGSPGRREIGHGALAERALSPVIPAESDFPYAIRVVSEITTSNGSTSMASTCGSTMSLMDAGVPILAPVSGISTGLVTSDGYPGKTEDYVLLTDINGVEDHYTDMDFKIAGTEKGITAIQLDVKIPGLTLDICKATFARSRAARAEILAAMLKVLPSARPILSQHAPKISTTKIPVDKIGELIGPGGKVIKKLMAETGTTIDVNDDGSVFVSGADMEAIQQALNWISGLGKEAVPGEVYTGTVARIQPFGAFVNILPGKDGLVHVSQMSQGFVSDPSKVVQEGQSVRVWVTEIDSQGRINLSMIFDDAGQPLVKARQDQLPPRRDNFRAPLPRRREDFRRRR